jgi:hypothetical protein
MYCYFSNLPIIKADYLGGYSVELEFGYGKCQKLNFKPFLRKSLHPEIRSYLNQDKFIQFRVEYGDLVWGGYELCFPVSFLQNPKNWLGQNGPDFKNS